MGRVSLKKDSINLINKKRPIQRYTLIYEPGEKGTSLTNYHQKCENIISALIESERSQGELKGKKGVLYFLENGKNVIDQPINHHKRIVRFTGFNPKKDKTLKCVLWGVKINA